MSFEALDQNFVLMMVYYETTSLTVPILRVSVEGPLSSKAALGMLKVLFPQWR
jgi:hypothetical protein